MGSWGMVWKTRKGKNIFYFFFPNRLVIEIASDERIRIVFVVKYKQYVYVLVACVCCAEARDIPTSSRLMWLSDRKTPSIQRYFSEAISH